MKENIEDVNEKKNNKKALYIIISVIILIIVGVGYYFYKNKENIMDNYNTESENSNEEDNKKYIKILDNKNILKSDLDLTENATINLFKVDKINDIVFLDIIEPDFQFETHYLFCFNRDGKLIFNARDFKDSDNDNNRYKYNGKFEYDETTNILTFYTNLFLGESDESAGVAFSDKFLSELTNAEKSIIGNYSDLVKYEYKYENKKMVFIEKKEISKLKDNAFYKDLLNDFDNTNKKNN